MARARSRFSADSTRAVGPASTSSRAIRSALGKSRRTWSRSCRTATTVRCSARQRWITDHEVVDGLGIDGGKRLVQQDEIGVLQQQAGEQHALELADRQRVDRPALEARQADRFDGVLGIVDVDVLGRAKAAEARPAAEQHGVEHRDREGAVDLGLLRQVGDALGRRIRCGPRCAARDRARPSGACSCRRRWGRRSPSSRLPEFPPTRDAPPDDGRSSPSGSPGAGPRSQRPPRGEPQQGRHAKCSRNASGRTHGEQRGAGRDRLMHDGNCYNIT